MVQHDVVGLSSRLKLSIVFRNGTALHVRDTILDGQRRNGAFHWQNAAGQLLMRWDNVAHWPQIDTYPHYKYAGEQWEVGVAEATSLEEGLAVIHPPLEHSLYQSDSMRRPSIRSKWRRLFVRMVRS